MTPLPAPGPQLPPPPSEEGTDPNIQISAKYVKDKAALEAARAAWRAGWIAGIACVVLITGLAFTGWFRIGEAIAQGKQEAVKDAGAETDKKLAPIQTDVAVLNTKVDRLSEDVARLEKAQKDSTEEILRAVRRNR